jgi:hypothetical protein
VRADLFSNGEFDMSVHQHTLPPEGTPGNSGPQGFDWRMIGTGLALVAVAIVVGILFK